MDDLEKEADELANKYADESNYYSWETAYEAFKAGYIAGFTAGRLAENEACAAIAKSRTLIRVADPPGSRGHVYAMAAEEMRASIERDIRARLQSEAATEPQDRRQ